MVRLLTRTVDVTVTPLSGWTRAAVPGVEQDAQRLAEHKAKRRGHVAQLKEKHAVGMRCAVVMEIQCCQGK